MSKKVISLLKFINEMRVVSNKKGNNCRNDRAVNITKSFITSFGLNKEYINYGCSRFVLKFGTNKVIKIAYNKSGIRANKVEYNRSCFKADDNRYAKISTISEDGLFLIMERCKPICDKQGYLLDSINEEDVPYHLISDDHRGNFGINKKGNIVVIDYADVWG